MVVLFGMKNIFHPAIFYTRLIRRSGRRGLEPIPAVIGRGVGLTLDRLPVHHRATQRQTRQTTAHTHTHTLLRTILKTPINLTCMFLDCERKLPVNVWEGSLQPTGSLPPTQAKSAAPPTPAGHPPWQHHTSPIGLFHQVPPGCLPTGGWCPPPGGGLCRAADGLGGLGTLGASPLSCFQVEGRGTTLPLTLQAGLQLSQSLDWFNSFFCLYGWSTHIDLA